MQDAKRVAAFACAAAVLASSAARAHPQVSATTTNCYLKLTLEGGGVVRVAWTLLVGDRPALAIRRAADGNGDGLVDEQELAGYAEGLARTQAAQLTLEIDGRPAVVEWDPPLVGLADRRVGPTSFSVDRLGKARFVGAGPHLLRVEDRTLIDDAGESELRIDEGPGTRLLGAWQGHEDGGTRSRFAWAGPRQSRSEDRTVGARFVDERAPRPLRRRLSIGLAAAFLVAAAAAVLLRRARPRRR